MWMRRNRKVSSDVKQLGSEMILLEESVLQDSGVPTTARLKTGCGVSSNIALISTHGVINFPSRQKCHVQSFLSLTFTG